MFIQEIVINPDIFEKISRASSLGSYELIDFKSYNDNLKLKKILFDKDEAGHSIIFNKINEIKKSSSDFGKHQIDYVLRNILSPGKFENKEIFSGKIYCSNKILNQILNLCLLSESKIINSEDKSSVDLKDKNEELRDIEFLNFEEFIKPTDNSRIFSLEKEINVKRGEKFLFEEYFRPYLSEVKKIKVTDRFIRKREGGYLNLIRILKICNKLEKLELFTIVKKSRKSISRI